MPNYYLKDGHCRTAEGNFSGHADAAAKQTKLPLLGEPWRSHITVEAPSPDLKFSDIVIIIISISYQVKHPQLNFQASKVSLRAIAESKPVY